MNEDDLASDFLSSRGSDSELDADLDALRTAKAHSEEKGFMAWHGDQLMQEAAADQKGNLAAGQFLMRLPANITVGVLDAATAAIGFGKQFAEGVKQNVTGPGVAESAIAADQGLRKPAPGQPGAHYGSAQEAREGADVEPYGEEQGMLMGAMARLRGRMAAGSGTPDEITQSAAQFMVPFAAWTKAVGGYQAGSTAVNAGRAALAEAATMMTSFEPHEARFADLLRLLDSRNTLVNSYIDWMTAREDEGEWEGRFKNALDSLVGTGVMAGITFTGGKALRSIRKSLAGRGTIKPSELKTPDVTPALEGK